MVIADERPARLFLRTPINLEIIKKVSSPRGGLYQVLLAGDQQLSSSRPSFFGSRYLKLYSG